MTENFDPEHEAIPYHHSAVDAAWKKLWDRFVVLLNVSDETFYDANLGKNLQAHMWVVPELATSYELYFQPAHAVEVGNGETMSVNDTMQLTVTEQYPNGEVSAKASFWIKNEDGNRFGHQVNHYQMTEREKAAHEAMFEDVSENEQGIRISVRANHEEDEIEYEAELLIHTLDAEINRVLKAQ
jgi:hypothetical protein